jgi:phosphoribosylformylglycinamidine cyclo-ligase
MESITYKDAGVDIELGDECSKLLYEASLLTWNNRADDLGKIITEYSYFGALRYVRISQDPELILGMNSDGVGTKIELAERLGDHRTIAFDLFAMVCDDAAIRGAEPVLLASVLDFSRLNIEVVKQLSEGMVKAAQESKICVINGEIAELGNRVNGFGDYNYNWSATVIWAAQKKYLKKFTAIMPGTKIIAVKESGIRSNGISLVRQIMVNKYGELWHTTPEGAEMLKWAISPSRIYTPLLIEIHGGYKGQPKGDIAGAVHITGGGIPGKLGRALRPLKVGAILDNLFSPNEELLLLQKWGKVPDYECYKTWNMGQGLLILSNDSKPIIDLAKLMGFEAREAGFVTDKPEIIIKSRGDERNDGLLTFQI